MLQTTGNGKLPCCGLVMICVVPGLVGGLIRVWLACIPSSFNII